jgi:hypothetical protein
VNTRLARIAAAVSHEALEVQRARGCTCNPFIDVELNRVGAVISLAADHSPECELDIEAATIHAMRVSCAFPVGDPRLN